MTTDGLIEEWVIIGDVYIMQHTFIAPSLLLKYFRFDIKPVAKYF